MHELRTSSSAPKTGAHVSKRMRPAKREVYWCVEMESKCPTMKHSEMLSRILASSAFLKLFKLINC